MTSSDLHVDTLIFIPTSNIYVFWYSLQTDRQMEKLIWGGLGNYLHTFLQVNWVLATSLKKWEWQ
jgi:hypothetical protein